MGQSVFPFKRQLNGLSMSNRLKVGLLLFMTPSIKPEGTLWSVLVLKNLNEPALFNAEEPHFKYSSTIETQLINCANKSYKNKRIQIWSLKGGTGDLKKEYEYSNKNHWGKVKKGSIQEALHEKVCLIL